MTIRQLLVPSEESLVRDRRTTVYNPLPRHLLPAQLSPLLVDPVRLVPLPGRDEPKVDGGGGEDFDASKEGEGGC